MSYHLTVDTIAALLNREGWSVGDVAVRYAPGWASAVKVQQIVANRKRAIRWLFVAGDSDKITR
jgi:hypothetical protein